MIGATETETHLSEPALMFSSQIGLMEDRRVSTRERKNLTTQLTDVGGTEVIRCPALDVSPGGVFVQAPFGSGVAVGKRYEVVLADSECGTPLADTCYATVVRTEVPSPDRPQIIGAGMRFDQPLFL